MKAAILFLLSGAAFASSGGDITIRRDEPLQTTWFVPHKIPVARKTVIGDAWQFYPTVGQTFRQDRKWLVLNVRYGGTVQRDFGSADAIVFAIDGETVTLADVSFLLDPACFSFCDAAHGMCCNYGWVAAGSLKRA
jgi:hypothetical protein